MRTLILLRGVPNTTQKQFIEKNKLQDYYIDVKEISKLVQSPSLNGDGEFFYKMLSHRNLWHGFTSKILEQRMMNGDMIVLDDNHLYAQYVFKYKELTQKFRYRVFYINLSCNYEEAVKNNPNLDEKTLKDMLHALQHEVMPKWCEKITNFKNNENFWIDDLNKRKYQAVKIIGDVQGCYTVLYENLFKNGFEPNTKYIFVGDLLDRGIENKKVFDFIYENLDNPDLVLIEGNHEYHLNCFSKGYPISNKIFITKTLPELLEINPDTLSFEEDMTNIELLEHVLEQADEKVIESVKEKAHAIYKRCYQLYAFSFYGKKYLCTHGGISSVPNLLRIPTHNFIYGTGNHNDGNYVAQKYQENYKLGLCQNFIQVSGHRPAKSNDVFINLIDDSFVEYKGEIRQGVEYGGALVVLGIDKDGAKKYFYRNNIF